MLPTREKDAVLSAETRDRPFDPELIKRAQALAARYYINVRPEQEGFAGTVAEFPSVYGHGTSEAAALTATRDLLKWAIAFMLESGRKPN
jgi:predicted RNase H-like HicB family nuclease